MNTIQDILELSKLDSGQVRVERDNVQITELVSEVLSYHKAEAEKKGLQLLHNYSENADNASVPMDRNIFTGILGRLLNNAIKFTDKGSMEVGCKLDKDRILIYVRDSGRGIPVDSLDVIFDRFVQVDMSSTREHEGSGLGLSIVKSYTELLGGEIWVESSLGTGSTFYLSFPLQPGKNQDGQN